jgi:hypothetical protein
MGSRKGLMEKKVIDITRKIKMENMRWYKRSFQIFISSKYKWTELVIKG